jgi:organizing structure protein 2
MSPIGRLGLLAASGFGVGLASAALPIRNESTPVRRRFYEDESDIVPVPGTVTAAPGTELEVLGQNRLVDGVLVRSLSGLESFFKRLRQSVAALYAQSVSYLDQGYSHLHHQEHQISSTLSALHAKNEDLLPNGIYVIVAALLGNIAARQRNVLAKLTFPVVLGLASFRYFLPQTFARTAGFVWQLEEQKVPHLADTQALAVAKTHELVDLIGRTTSEGQAQLELSVQSLKASIAAITGLNLDEEVSKK